MAKSTQLTNFGGESWIVIYRRPGDPTLYHEQTDNVPSTVNNLEAQGFIIIDIIDDSYAIPAVMYI